MRSGLLTFSQWPLKHARQKFSVKVDCPGQKPPFLAVRRPARPYPCKSNLLWETRRALARPGRVRAVIAQKKLFHVSGSDQNDEASSNAKSTPPIGAPKAAATPAAQPPDTKSRCRTGHPL